MPRWTATDEVVPVVHTDTMVETRVVDAIIRLILALVPSVSSVTDTLVASPAIDTVATSRTRERIGALVHVQLAVSP